MTASDLLAQQIFFVRQGVLKPTENLGSALVVRRDRFIKQADGEDITFIVVSLMLVNGRIVRVVEDPEHLPLLDEMNDALEKIRASAH